MRHLPGSGYGHPGQQGGLITSELLRRQSLRLRQQTHPAGGHLTGSERLASPRHPPQSLRRRYLATADCSGLPGDRHQPGSSRRVSPTAGNLPAFRLGDQIHLPGIPATRLPHRQTHLVGEAVIVQPPRRRQNHRLQQANRIRNHPTYIPPPTDTSGRARAE